MICSFKRTLPMNKFEFTSMTIYYCQKAGISFLTGDNISPSPLQLVKAPILYSECIYYAFSFVFFLDRIQQLLYPRPVLSHHGLEPVEK